MKAGVIGLGFMGATHVAAYQGLAKEGLCELVAVADHKASRRAGMLGDVGGNLDSGSGAAAFDAAIVHGYETAEALLADEAIELVSICTATPTHIDFASQALRGGKHVLVEKPVAHTAGEVAALAQVARDSGRVCMPGMCMRFWPGWTELKDAVVTRKHGRLVKATFTRRGARPAWSGFYADDAQSGGALLDLHIHDTDFIVHLLGEPAAVDATGSLQHVRTTYHYPDGPHIQAEGSWEDNPDFPFTMRYTASFEQATLDFDIARPCPLRRTADGQTVDVLTATHTGYEGEIRHLLTCLRDGKRPSVTLENAIVTHRVIDAERAGVSR